MANGNGNMYKDYQDRYGNFAVKSGVGVSENSYPNGPLGAIYLVSVQDTSKRFEFQFVPNELSGSRKISMAEVAIVGRNNPEYHYTGGEDTLKFEIDIYAEEQNREDVRRKVNMLKTFANKDGNGKKLEQLRLVFGRLFKDEVWVVKSFDYRYKNFHKRYGLLPQQAYVSITLGLDTPNNTRHSDISY